VKQTRLLMGMPITVEIVDPATTNEIFDVVYDYFNYVDETFSTYKYTSEISRINRHEISLSEASEDMKTIFAVSEQTKKETDGYFNIEHNGNYDPSGVVKGWAIYNAAQILRLNGFENFYVDAGGDIQMSGCNADGENWRVGIRNPFNPEEIVKVLSLTDRGVATSGTYVRGQHIYNPFAEGELITDILSLTVVGPDIYEADRFATAAFAMGKDGINFIESLEDFEGYIIDKDKQATFTTGFKKWVLNA
jgi:thiamine biosynthesis lipoprotein